MIIHLSKTRKGELYLFSEALLWSAFPVVTILSFQEISPIFSAAVSSLLSSLFFATVVTFKRGWKQWNRRSPWKDILIGSFFIGFVFYTLFFTGLKYTTAGNASIVALMEVFFTFLFLTVLVKHEPIVRSQVWGAVCMVAGAAVILLPKSSGWHAGDLFIIAGTAITPLANKYMQRARTAVSSEFILFVRSLFAGICLLVLACFSEPIPSSAHITNSIPVLFINGLLIFGLSKFLWLESINLIPITKAISLASIAPFFTLIFAFFILQERMTAFQLLALPAIVTGVFLLMRPIRAHHVMSLEH